jgi:hypothetical protein
MGNLFVGGLSGERLDVHDQRLEAGRFHCGHAVFDLFLAGGSEQNLHIIRAAGRLAEHLKVQIHFIQREGIT